MKVDIVNPKAGYLSNHPKSGYRQLVCWLPLQSPKKWISSTRLLVTSPIRFRSPRGFLYQFSSKSLTQSKHIALTAQSESAARLPSNPDHSHCTRIHTSRPERHGRRPRPQQANPKSGYRQRVAGYLSNPNESGYRQPEGWLPLQSPEKWISSTRLLVTSPIRTHPPRGFLYQFSSKSLTANTHAHPRLKTRKT